MAEELVSPQKIREDMKGEKEAVESIARTQEIYLQAQENKESPFPLTHTYLLALAKDEKTSAIDTFLVGKFMEKYPQIPVETTTDTRMGKIALPMGMILNNFDRSIKIATEAGYDLEQTGEELIEKAKSVLGKIEGKKQEEFDKTVFQAMEKTGGIPSNLAKNIQEVWWERIIPNMVTGKLLKKSAVKREPSLAIQKGTSQ